MLQAPQPLNARSLRFSRLPKNIFQHMPQMRMRMRDRPREMELLTRHTSRTGILPAVSFTKRPRKEKMRDARNEHVSPESQITLQQRHRCSELTCLKLGPSYVQACQRLICRLIFFMFSKHLGLANSHDQLWVRCLCGCMAATHSATLPSSRWNLVDLLSPSRPKLVATFHGYSNIWSVHAQALACLQDRSRTFERADE